MPPPEYKLELQDRLELISIETNGRNKLKSEFDDARHNAEVKLNRSKFTKGM